MNSTNAFIIGLAIVLSTWVLSSHFSPSATRNFTGAINSDTVGLLTDLPAKERSQMVHYQNCMEAVALVSSSGQFTGNANKCNLLLKK
jgi:hypothetical protein